MIIQSPTSPIGLFDSGVGGLSVWREIRRYLPHENTRYIADQAHLPYGPRTLKEIRGFARGITEFLIDQRCKAVVIACNTASGAALHILREQFSHMPFIGMEPAVKPAAENTKTGAIGVIATPTTFQGDLFRRLAARFGKSVQIHTRACPGLVELVESGQSNTLLAEKAARCCIEPLLQYRIDQLVLGCTHYPFLASMIKQIIGPDITLVDPSPAIARQVERVLCSKKTLNRQSQPSHHILYTSSSDETLKAFVDNVIADPRPEIQQVIWEKNRLIKRNRFRIDDLSSW